MVNISEDSGFQKVPPIILARQIMVPMSPIIYNCMFSYFSLELGFSKNCYLQKYKIMPTVNRAVVGESTC